MRVVLVGLGSIGKRHLGNIRTLEPDAEVTVVRHARTNDAVPDGVDRVVYSIDEAVDSNPEVAFICGPTTRHADVGVALAGAGAHLFVEKPIAADSTSARRLIDAAVSANRSLVVGYNLRFLPSMRALRHALAAGEIGRPMSVRAEVGQYLPDWRPGADYRQGNSARGELGGGLEFELSHEIDYVRWLMGEISSVSALFAKTSDLEIDVDDTAELLCGFSSGAIGSIHLDMTLRAPKRTCWISGTDGVLAWDAIAGEAKRFRTSEGWTVLSQNDGDRNVMYVEEIKHVFACARGTERPLVDGEDGLRVVEIAEAARRAFREGRKVTL